MILKEIEAFEPIKGKDQSSFARFTMRNRLPRIIGRLKARYISDQNVLHRLDLLEEEMLSGYVRSVPAGVNDKKIWLDVLEPYMGMKWMEAPFFLVEVYFYTVALEAVNYFETRQDPFFDDKKNDMESNLAHMQQLIREAETAAMQEKDQFIQYLLGITLWGNKSDLSQIHSDRSRRDEEDTLINDSKRIVKKFSGNINRVDIILDNAGVELLTDLIMAFWLVKLNYCQLVVLHAKSSPTFVSDATKEDISLLLELLTFQTNDSMKGFIHALVQFIQAGTIKISDDDFWNSPLHFYQMPTSVSAELSQSDLIFVKGDANYRRIFGDRQIPHDHDPETMAYYLPAPTVAIRILKSEIICGLPQGMSEMLTKSDPDWLISGKYGIIQIIH